MSNTSLLGSFGGQAGDALMFRNKLINGNFDIWQRGTSQTASGLGSDDRWSNENNGSTKTHSRQAFTAGQTDVPNNPTYFSRTVVTSVAGAGNYCNKNQRIENVSLYSGQTVTVSFWAKADASKNMAVEFTQYFGTGGSPSTEVNGLGVATVALTTGWKKYTVTTVLPSVSGKTLGTDKSSLLVLFWFDAGLTFNSRTNSLGQQSGTFDIAQVQLELGPVATSFEIRPLSLEEQLCLYYFQRGFLGTGRFDTATVAQIYGRFICPMRAAPALSNVSGTLDEPGLAARTITAASVSELNRFGGRIQFTVSGATAGSMAATTINTDIWLSSELS